MKSLPQKSRTNKRYLPAGMLLLIFISGCLFNQSAPATETSIPMDRVIEMTFSAAGTQTAVSYSSTPPTATFPATTTLLPTITFEPTMTFQVIPSLLPPTGTFTITPTGTPCNTGDQQPYVYSPDRLIVLADCIHVTGIIDEIENAADGDLHILLRLDREYQHYLKPANPGDKYLVVEPICVNKPIQPNAIKACALNPNPIRNLPKVRDHVWMEGRYVTDTFHNNWAEIHPLGAWGYVTK